MLKAQYYKNGKEVRVSYSGTHSITYLLPVSILPCLLPLFPFLILKSQASFYVLGVNVSVITRNSNNYIIPSKRGSWPLVSSHSQPLNISLLVLNVLGTC